MKIIREIKGLKSNGHYAQAVIHDSMIFLSGQFSVNPETGEKKFGTIEEETLQVLKNMDFILQSLGSSKEKVLKVTLYISDLSQWDNVNRVYGEFFGNHYPARTIAAVSQLHFGFQVEADVIAYK